MVRRAHHLRLPSSLIHSKVDSHNSRNSSRSGAGKTAQSFPKLASGSRIYSDTDSHNSRNSSRSRASKTAQSFPKLASGSFIHSESDSHNSRNSSRSRAGKTAQSFPKLASGCLTHSEADLHNVQKSSRQPRSEAEDGGPTNYANRNEWGLRGCSYSLQFVPFVGPSGCRPLPLFVTFVFFVDQRSALPFSVYSVASVDQRSALGGTHEGRVRPQHRRSGALQHSTTPPPLAQKIHLST